MHRFQPEELQNQQAFLRRLSRQLVRDEQGADDLVQETWVALLQAPHAWIGRLRPWLGTVMRRLAINRAVAERSRQDHERQAARCEVDESGNDLDDLLHAQTRVLEALRELPEPLRSTLHKRYSDGLSPSAIARELGLPVPTIKTRLARGRELLRARLDVEFGKRSAWCTMLLPSIPLRPFELSPIGLVAVSQASGLGVLWMSTFWKAAGALAALGLFGTYLWTSTPAVAPLELAVSPDSRGTTEVHPAGQTPRVPRESQRELAESFAMQPQASAPDQAPELAPSNLLWSGQVFDSETQPVPGVHIAQRLNDGSTVATSEFPTAAGGRFEIAVPAARGRLEVQSREWITLLAAPLAGSSTSVHHPLVAARRVRYGGRVTDTSGQALAGAQLAMRLPDGLRRRFDLVLERAQELPRETQSASDGTFAFEAGTVRGATLQVSLENYLPLTVPLDAHLTEALTLVLRRPGELADSIHGLVVNQSGWPVEGAYVSFGAEMVRSDHAGRFDLARGGSERAYANVTRALGRPSRTLRAVYAEHQPGSLQVELDPQTGNPIWPDGLVLELGPAPKQLEGVVLDEDGDGVPGAWVWLQDTTYFSAKDGGCSVEALAGMGPGERHLMVRTDANGEFLLKGLQDQDYVVVAAHPQSFEQIQSTRVRAGTDSLELQFSAGGCWTHVSGQIVDREGMPLPGVQINVMADVANLYLEGKFVRTSSWLTASATSDSEGHFQLTDLPKRSSYLFLRGPATMSSQLATADLGDADALALEGTKIVLARRVHARVTLGTGELANAISILDPAGLPLGLRVEAGKPGPVQQRMPIHGDRTDILSVPDYGCTLVLYQEGIELTRRAIRLVSDELNEL